MNCKCCGYKIDEDLKSNEYYLCEKCNSYNLIVENTAEEDNKKYFDSIFTEYAKMSHNNVKILIYKIFSKVDSIIRNKKSFSYNKKKKLLFYSFDKNKLYLEIGFGQGVNLKYLLDKGYDIIGVDLSESAVNNFRKLYPHYSNKVFLNSELEKKDFKFDIIYCSALLEHIDNQNDFLSDVYKKLNDRGRFIIDALPVINKYKKTISEDYDISFWKPEHRILYSVKGIKIISEKNNFSLESYGMSDSYNYRLLSFHKKHGYLDIEKYRDSTLKFKKSPNVFYYFILCIKALFIRSKCLIGIFALRKQ